MAMTIDELSERLDMEIAARELLERKLSAQSSSISNVETRLSSQIQSAVSSMDSRLHSAEGLIQNESIQRSDGDELLSTTTSANKVAIQAEENARLSSEEDLRQQIQSSQASATLLDSRIANCESSIKENANTLSDETQERVDQCEKLELSIQNAQADFQQKIADVQGLIAEMDVRANSLDEKIASEADARKTTDDNVLLNAGNIDKTNQKIEALSEALEEANNKFLDEPAVSNMINDSFVESFAAQMQTIRDILNEDQASREADIANIQDYAARAQNASSQAQSTLENYRQEAKNTAAAMREAFNLLLPKGTILPYSGDLAAIPDGWKLCNGAYGTPDLVGKVLVGAHAVAEDDAEFVLGKEGGEKEVNLASDNMPNHYHYTGFIGTDNKGTVLVNDIEEGKTAFKDIPTHKKLWGARSWDGSGDASYVYSGDMLTKEDKKINAITSSQVADDIARPHNNMQPYHCVYYIMKMF